MHICRYVFLVLSGAFVVVYGVSCVKSNNAMTFNMETVVADIENQTALDLPPDVVILSADDGGGRDPNYNYYEWVLFSPSSITLPKMQLPGGVTNYLDLQLDTTVPLIESRLKGRKLTQPRSTLSTEWVVNEAKFEADLVEAKDGVYVIIMRFRKP
ncbi:MAG: hypothetical protein GX174_14905 [Lentisphaerae bacterium]|nr:hypothetical protein [Lentisphaerota bacterium]